jgi:hypothetical protein
MVTSVGARPLECIVRAYARLVACIGYWCGIYALFQGIRCRLLLNMLVRAQLNSFTHLRAQLVLLGRGGGGAI